MIIRGNNIVSTEEEAMASYLRDRNLATVNAKSQEVRPKVTFYTRYGKRVIDLMVIIPVIIVLSPLMAGLAFINLIDLGRPVFYRQTRLGYHGKNFDMFKYRSMRDITDKNGCQLPGDQRLTVYGQFIRRFSLDELGNFINILKGDMSIIGPRAMPVFFQDRMSDRHKMRVVVKPGLECPRMIDLKEDDVGEYHLQFENDIWYVEHISLWTDIRMIFALVKMVFASRKRKYHAGVGTFFTGYNDAGIGISFRLAKEQYPDILWAIEHSKVAI